MFVSISKSLAGRYKISFFTPPTADIQDGLLTKYLTQQDKNDLYKKLFDKLADDTERDYDYEALCRSKMTVIDYGENNEWTWFSTFTFDQRKIDREDIRACYDKLRIACNHYRNRVDSSFRYLLIPEYHADGQHVHFHGLIYTAPDNPDITGPYKTWSDKHNRFITYFRSEFFFDRFGAVNLSPVATNSLYVSAYVTKYMTKQQFMIFGNRYICSQGLKRSDRFYFDSQEEFALEMFERIRDTDILGQHLKPCTRNEYTISYSLDQTQFELIFGG